MMCAAPGAVGTGSSGRQLGHERSAHVYDHPEKKLRAESQGSVQLLPNGDGLSAGEPFRRDGELVLDGMYSTGTSYRAYRFQWIATPTEDPALAVEPTPSGALVHASWNGATKVASWQVLGGATKTTLSVVGAVARTGFETANRVQRHVARVRGRALDASGTVPATSKGVAVLS